MYPFKTTSCGYRCTAGISLLHMAVCALVMLLVLDTSPASAETPYHIGPGDTLTITVFGQTALSGQFKISADGYISIPLIGEISVADLTRSEIEVKISHLLADQLPGAGRVSVGIAEYAPVFLLGDAERPGRYEFRPGMIPLELLALGGGPKRFLIDPQHDPAMQLIALEQELTDQRLVRYSQAATRARLLAEINGTPFNGTVDPADDQPIMLAQKQRILQDEQELFRVHAEILANREKALKEQQESYKQEMSVLTQSIALQSDELKMLSQEIDTAQGLLGHGLATMPRLLSQKRELSAAKRNALELQGFLARAQEHVLAIQLEIEDLHNTRANDLAQALHDLDIAIARAEEKLSATSTTLGSLRSTGAGSQMVSIKFTVVRLVNGEYRTATIGDHDALEPRDIVQIERELPAQQGNAGPAASAATTAVSP
jgi:polysaccharide export outer membrane protein